MYQTIHENIAVAGVFAQASFAPRKFQWRNREYGIEEVTYTAEWRDGGVRTRQYSVVSAGNMYRLLYNRETEEWWLEEVWCEG